MTVLLVVASVFWALFFAYPWIDFAMGNNGWLETRLRDWLFDFAEAEGKCSWFAPMDIEQLMKDAQR